MRTILIVATLVVASSAGAVAAPLPDEPPPASDDPPRNYALAFLEGPVLYNVLQNLAGRAISSEATFDSSWDSFVDNLGGPWEYDDDKFKTNLFAHPYQGTIYFTAGRSLGLNFWESFLNTILGSLIWELAGETERPSVNDQITTSTAGALLGEVLFRLAYRTLDVDGHPGLWRELGAFLLSPVNSANRAWSLDGYRFPDLTAQSWYVEGGVDVGVGGESTSGEDTYDPAGDVALRLEIVNGLPAGDWKFRRPMDHFDLRLSLVLGDNSFSAEARANFTIRGLLLGGSYGGGEGRGLWGMFGAYDYLTPGSFRVSSTNVAFGTVGQVPLAAGLTLQGTAYAGLGYGAGGSLNDPVGRRDYHFGVQGVALAEARLVWADRIRLTIGTRGYYTSGAVSPESDAFEWVGYLGSRLTVRVWGPHAFAFGWTGASRRAAYPALPDIHSRASAWDVAYVAVLDPGLGIGR